MENYEIVPIRNFIDAIEVRKIRNQCRLFMTNHTSEISLVNQFLWYFKTYKKEHKNKQMTCYLFKINNVNVGFGLIKKQSGKYWITGGLNVDQRGKGLGKVLFKNILQNVPSNNVWLEVLDSNIAAKRIYQKLQFKEVDESKVRGKKIIIMHLKLNR